VKTQCIRVINEKARALAPLVLIHATNNKNNLSGLITRTKVILRVVAFLAKVTKIAKNSAINMLSDNMLTAGKIVLSDNLLSAGNINVI
jgi:hypothetical protein